MSQSTAIVVTTIFEPEFVTGYLETIRESNQAENTTMYIICDKKTPATVYERAKVACEEGFRVECPTLDEQDAYLQKLVASDDFIPYNTDNRRNIGYLMALENGCDVLISIDDDNFVLPNTNYLTEHQQVGSSSNQNVVKSSDNWFNICSLLSSSSQSEIFARGFPYFAQRYNRETQLTSDAPELKIAANAGLWLDEPDVDAVYRLCQRPKISTAEETSVVLGPDVWSPINTQNTALSREAALTYYYVKMGFPLRGLSIDRFGDILSGYLMQKCVKHLGQGIRVGSPVVDHRRTPHNFFKDLYHELAGIVLIEDFLPWLIDAKLEGSTSLDAYESLTNQIAGAADQFTGFIWDDGGRDFLKSMAKHMQQWIKIVRKFQ